MHRYLLALVGVLVLAAMTTPALASPPVTTTEEFTVTDSTVVTNCADLGTTYAFAISENATGSVRSTTYVDAQGVPVRRQLHIKYRGAFTNSVTGYTVVSEPDSLNIMENLRDHTSTVVGLGWSINVPGEGHVLVNAGRLVFDDTTGALIVEAGQHDFEAGGFALLCRILE